MFAVLLMVISLHSAAGENAPDPPKKNLPLDGEVFDVSGRTAFLIPAKADPHATAKPWVWYAPTLPNLPGPEEKWMFERFRAAGIAVAGIDAGESYGSPAGNKIFDTLYAAMKARGYSAKPVLLGRSRGGLMTLSWAVANPDKVGGVAGIYPVCDITSYPGVERAARAFEMKADELKDKLKQFNPVDRLEGLAKAKVPLFAIHGDIDKVVPLDANSGRMKERYAALGASMTLIVPSQQGHNMWQGFFQCPELVEFVIANAVASGHWQPQAIKSDADFRGLCAVSPKVAWVSSTKGTFCRTTDGGKTWAVGTVPGADKLDFRDVEAFGEDTAYLMSAGPGEESRIYKTTNGGKTWALQFKNAEPKAFFNSIAFWDEKHGIALSDPVDGRFRLIVTDDGGAKWTSLPEKSQPVALPNEGAFAASGTCLVTHGENDVWFCTGGAKAARVFHSGDRGKTWNVHETPLLAGIESAGAFSIAFRDRDHGIIVGGDFRKPDGTEATVAVTTDSGKTWKLIEKPLPFRSGVTWAKDRWVAVGTSGSDISVDDGATWKPLDREKYNSVAFTATDEGWAVGPKGRIAKFVKADK